MTAPRRWYVVSTAVGLVMILAGLIIDYVAEFTLPVVASGLCATGGVIAGIALRRIRDSRGDTDHSPRRT